MEMTDQGYSPHQSEESEKVANDDHVFVRGSRWYFEDVIGHEHGPYKSKAEAELALTHYIEDHFEHEVG
jgi:hypothetical protein